MKGEQLSVEIEAGIPPGTLIAQKTGVESDTHNDVAIIMTPGGDYVLVTFMHGYKWLYYTDSFPAMAEISQLIYNTYNPNQPMTKLRDRTDYQCVLDKTLLSKLQTTTFPAIR
jgi:hypothetical protein